MATFAGSASALSPLAEFQSDLPERRRRMHILEGSVELHEHFTSLIEYWLL